MPRTRLLTILWPVAIAVLALGLLLGCESTPTAPSFQNPFDPSGPDGGDPLDLTATVVGNTIILSWNQPQGFGISSYSISHSVDTANNFEFVTSVEQTEKPKLSFIYADPDPTRIHYFKVQAFNAAGDFTFVADQTPAFVATGPAIAVEGNPVGKMVASRHVHLTVTVSSQDSILMAGSPDFSSAVSFPVTQPGSEQAIIWDLPAAAQGDTFHLYAKGYTGTFASAVTVRDLIVDFSPEFHIVGKPATVPARHVDLEIEELGVEQMRFATTQAALATAAWLPADSTLTGFALDASAVSQTIYGEFQGDFGFNATGTWNANPDLMQNAAFRLALPAGDVTAATTVTGISTANAIQMRFSTQPDFLSSPWQTYADTAAIVLDAAEGLQTIYAQYRNDWTDSAILTDTVVHILQPVSVGFLAPLDGQVVLGGVPLQILGYSTDSQGKAAVDSLQLDLGDGAGFRSVTGTDSWSYLWDVPRFESDTNVTLRARAWAAGESSTTTIGVTATQLTMLIGAPLDGAELKANTEVTIAGLAHGLLNGPPLDQVTVAVDGQTIVATGTETWSASWQTPAVTESTDFTIVVTIQAGAESLTQEITVTVVPPVP